MIKIFWATGVLLVATIVFLFVIVYKNTEGSNLTTVELHYQYTSKLDTVQVKCNPEHLHLDNGDLEGYLGQRLNISGVRRFHILETRKQ